MQARFCPNANAKYALTAIAMLKSTEQTLKISKIMLSIPIQGVNFFKRIKPE